MKMEHENNAEDDATSAVAAIVADADNSVSSNAVLPQYNYVRRRKCNENAPICEKKKKRESFRRISSILRKPDTLRTDDEARQLDASADIVRQIVKRREHLANVKDRILEKEDPLNVIETKARKLADVLSRAQHLVVYTGAGVSTSARIPDYRGSQGIWTLLQQGKDIGQHDLTLAEPTFTHMALYELHRRNILRYTLSQNCDGLHLRSGLPRKSLSEVHGNMFIEVCKHCKPNIEYWRLFDTTELTARFNHKTNRRCHFCLKPLIDTIVHFGERGRLKWPLNWDSACKNAEKADVILCLGSSLKVLKKYSWLWAMDRPKAKRPKIYIVNLQWTPKDKNASLKINGKCDEVMRLVMDAMSIKVMSYNRLKDPIFAHASLLLPEELHTVSQPMLKHHIDDDSWKHSGTETTESDSNKLEESDGNGAGRDALDAKSIVAVAAVDERKSIKIEETQPEADSGIDLCSESMKGEKIKCELSTDDREVSQAEIGNGMKLEIKTEKYSICDATQNDLERSANIESSILPKTNSDSIQRVLTSAQGDAKEHGKISDIQHRLNQLLVMKQKSFLLHCTSPTKSSTSGSNNQHNSTATVAIGQPTDEHSSNSKSFDTTESGHAYYKSLINYYRAIEGVVPHWYDVNYAYSGLHSIIHPPPNEVDIWGSIIIPIFQLNRNVAECDFCFDNYAEDKCQFYRSSQRFMATPVKRRNGKLVLCECCDFSDNDERIDDDIEAAPVIDSNECGADIDDDESKISNNSDNEADCVAANRLKRAKLDAVKEVVAAAAKIQPGWYGKGYRKITRKKKRRQYQIARE